MKKPRKQYRKLQDDALPGGKASARRGEQHHEMALAFIKDFPIGTVLSDARFDEWAEQHLGMEIPDYGTVEWKGHIQRRAVTIKQIKSASTHPRMWDSGQKTYRIECLAHGSYEVQEIDIRLQNEKQSERELSLKKYNLRQKAYSCQATNWPDYPPEAIGLARYLLYADEQEINIHEYRRSVGRGLANDLAMIMKGNKEQDPPSPSGSNGTAQENDDLTDHGAESGNAV